MINRRQIFRGIAATAGGLFFEPLRSKIASAASGNFIPPKRVVFFIFDNGFQDDGTLPLGMKLETDSIKQIPLQGLRLPLDIEPFTPFIDKMTILNGLRTHGAVDHGGLFHALSGSYGNKSTPQDESIDAAIVKDSSSVIPLLHLGVGGDSPISYCCSAWGRARPIAAICRPEMAYESLFGSIGATRNDFLMNKNLLDFVIKDIKNLRSSVAAPERELVESHLHGLELFCKRENAMSDQFASGQLQKYAPQISNTGGYTGGVINQCSIAASALISGITNVVTISVGLGVVPVNYSGFTSSSPHGLGHGDPDKALGMVKPFEVLSHLRNFHATQVASLINKLKSMPEGDGTMFDNTVIVFMSDNANQQHCWKGANWPFVLVGNLGGSLTSGQYLSYPVSRRRTWDDAGIAMGAAMNDNPVTNALYTTLLHAVGKPRDTFNRSSSSIDPPFLYGPLSELLT